MHLYYAASLCGAPANLYSFGRGLHQTTFATTECIISQLHMVSVLTLPSEILITTLSMLTGVKAVDRGEWRSCTALLFAREGQI